MKTRSADLTPRNRPAKTVGLIAISLALAAPASGQLYRNSIASTDFDFITEADPSAFEKLEFVRREEREMMDKRVSPRDVRKDAYVFQAYFSDNSRVILLIDAAFGDEEAARAEAMRYVHPLGKLPTSLRVGLGRGLIVHQGGEETTAFAERGVIAIYSDTATKRIANHDLEETIFHESVHASWDRKHEHSKGWRAAQASDNAFVTEYAKKRPKVEDLAESALFAFTLLHHPERLPEEDAAKIRALIPNRIAYIKKLLPPGQSIFTPVLAVDHPRADWSHWCDADISLAGVLADILSNALRIDYGKESDVLRKNYEHGEELFQAVVAELAIEPEKLKESIQRHMHVNCKHGPSNDAAALEEIAGWRAAEGAVVARPGDVKADAGRSVAESGSSRDADQFAALRTEIAAVVVELRWMSKILIVGVGVTAVLLGLQLVRLRRR